uniref:Nestin n=1 Tax=Cyprinus carpio carpio TaxID=630221 RepID=A0A9J7X7X5_CYPCA
MEFLGGRLPFTQFQEEKYQMLELNQRLESYLGHVKLLEEENKLLREEIHTLKSSKEPSGQRKAQEEALSQARRMLEEAWRKKDHVVLEVENLMEDIEVVSIQRQKAKNAKAEAQRKLMESRKELEEERRAQIWLREKAGQLEKDLLLQMQVHQENMETSQASLKQTKQVLMAPHPTQTTSIPDLGQEYSHRAAQAWQEATNNYQRLFGRLEESLNQAKANMAKIHQEKRENQHQVQHLAKELESTKTKRQMLEKNVVQQREEHTQELQHLQAQVDALELEKDNLGQQIDSLMVDRQNLLQAKMSLGLEVATYRALLDSEGLRTDRPTTKKTSSAFFLDVLSKPTGTRPASQTTAASCNVSNTVSTSHRSITSSRTLLTRATPSWSPTQGTPQRTPTRTSVTEKTEVHISEETEKAAEESVDHLQQEKVHEGMVLAITLPKTAAEPEPQLKPEDTEIKEDEPIQFKKAQVVECKTDASALISVSADQPSNLYQTPETESWAGPFTDPAGGSEEGKDEDTEVSFEMAQISHAPKVAWEQNKSVADDEKNDASEMDARSENISESRTFACEDAENDDETLKSTHISANTNIMGSSFLEQGTLDLVGDFGYHEDLMKVNKQDNVSNISEEGREQMNSETDAAIDSINELDKQEAIEPQNEVKVVSPDSEEEEENETNIVADTEDKKEDENVTEREEEEEIDLIKSDFSVLDEGIDSPKNSDHQESLEKTVLPTEPHSDQTVNEEDPLKPEDTEIKEDEPIQFNLAQMVECKTDASALISVSADQPSNLYQTPETESWAGPFTDPAGDSEEGKDEDTEVSFEMAQISHAPTVAWEENKTVGEDEKDDASEMDVRSENISGSHTFACEDAWNDEETLKSSHISANTNIMGSSFLKQGTLDLVGDFGYHEDLLNVDKQDNVSNISEEGREQMNSETEAVIDSINEWDRQEEIEPENEMKVVSPDSEEEEDETNIVANTEDKKEDENVTEREEEEEIDVIKSDFSVLDEGVDSPKNSDHQESLEKTVLSTEPHSDQTVNEEDPLKPEDTEIKGDEPIQFKKAQMVECKTDASALISVSADQPSNLYQTPETESRAGPFTDPAGDSEGGKDEDTKVSFEMAQISHAPMVAWEENKTVAEDRKNDATEMDVRSENISESHTFACEDAWNDNETLKSSHISANTSIMGSSFLEQGTLDLVGDFGYHEDLMNVDKHDNVSNISEEGIEQMNSESDAAIDSINEWDRQEEIEPENEMKVVSPDSDEEEEDETNIVADTKDKKEDENVTEREEEIKVIKSDFSVLDEGVDSPKNSDHQESLEKTVLPTEPHSDQTVNEEDPLKPEDTEIKEDEPIQFKKAQMVECKTYASALTTVSADQPSNLYQTPETESGAGPFTDPAGDSEEGKDEDTEVCFEMAQISHTPTVAWEQNKTIAEDEKDDASEMDVKSENISESHRFAYEDAENDDDTLKSTHISANTNIMGSSFLEQGTLDLVGDFGYHEDLMKVDKQDNVSNISEEGREQMNSETEAVIDSINEWDRQEAIEPENEMKVVSPDSEEEEENETNIVADTEDKKEDENVTEREEEEVEVIKSDFSVLDEGIDSPKNSDHQESLEKTVLPTELHSDQTVNEEDYLPEESEGEEENQGEDDDSPNITSWRTDPGEYDSYSQENTIADTRPLIRYKSDEETNGNVLTSHLISETSDSEDEKERMEGGHWNDSASKCFNTMEDLAEEPDLEVTGEMMTEDVVSKEEVQEGDRVCIMLQSDSEVHESLDMVEKESARIELKVNLEEDSDVIKEIRKDEDHNVKVYEQPQLTENQLMHTEQPEDETVHSYESQKHPISFPETSHQLKNLFETPSTLTMFQDSAATKDPEDFLDVSMHTSMDLTESRSLESKISSQPDNLTSDIPNSDQEEGNSSEDESPNASQCFQNTSLLKVATLNEQPFTFTNGVSKADSVSDVNNLPEEVLSKEKNTEEPKAAQIDDWENSNIWSKSINAPDAAEITHASTIDENTGVFPVNVTESLDIPNKMAENIFGKFEEHLERTVESFSEKVLTVMDFESTSSGEKEELQSKEKKSEIHSFFSTSMKEDFWSQGEMEMAANYDPAETEDLNQAMVFGEEWRDMEGMPMANVSPKEKMDILKGQDEKHKDEQPTQSKMVLSYDSVDEEDSWSSGDE